MISIKVGGPREIGVQGVGERGWAPGQAGVSETQHQAAEGRDPYTSPKLAPLHTTFVSNYFF